MDMETHNPIFPGDPGARPGPEPGLDDTTAAASQAAVRATAAGLPGMGLGRSLRQLLGNLRLGVRLALFLRVDQDQFNATPGALALLALSDVIVNLAVSFLLVGRGGFLSYASVPGFLFHLPLLLLCGFLAGIILARPSLVTVIPVALVALSIPIELCHAVLERMTQFGRMGWLEGYLEAPHYFRFFWWWTAAALLFVSRSATAPALRRCLLLLLVSLLLAPLWLFPRGDLWVSGSEGGESGVLRLTEKVLAAQTRLLDEELAEILPGRKGVPGFYFVGFAGDATQDVFLKELMAAERLFAGRFGTAGRSVILANNPQTALDLPFASATNLELVLAKLGRVMNRDGDVLVLFLTSHGSREHELLVNNGPLELDGLTPERLRRALSKSGISWKVLVVSACYAGGFIEPLKDDRTLIITAADANHESFGCGYGEEFTWFGEAFLNGALRSTFSFTKAFEMARGTIRQWEKEQGETPSNPQIWVGRDIGEKLSVLERGLEGRDAREP